MTMADMITALCCRVDEAMTDVPPHSQQALAPSELVTIGLLHAFKGAGSRYCYLPRYVSLSAPSHQALPPPAHTSRPGQSVSWWRPAQWG